MASERQDIVGLQREETNECRSFLLAVIKDSRRLAFFKQLLEIVPKFVLLWLFTAFFPLSFSCYLYQVRGRHCEKRARRSYLQLNMN